MISTYKTYNIYDTHDEREVKVKLFTTKHVTDRFHQRSQDKEESKVMSVIEKALRKIVNDYPREDFDFMIKSNELGIKIPMSTEIENGDVRVSIPTILSPYMSTNKTKRSINLTVEDIRYSMYIEIEI